MYINKIQLCGIMDRPIIQVLENGKKSADFNLSMVLNLRNELGEKQNKSLSIQCKAWDQIATLIERFTQEGTEIALEGILSSSLSLSNQDNLTVLVDDLLILKNKQLV